MWRGFAVALAGVLASGSPRGTWAAITSPVVSQADPQRLRGAQPDLSVCPRVPPAQPDLAVSPPSAGSQAAAPRGGGDSGDSSTQEPLLVDVTRVVGGVRLDMPYARHDNLTGEPLYPVGRCLLRPEVAAMVQRAQAYLQARRPNLTLLLKDCYRPVSAQARLFQAVAGTPSQGYVANPNRRHGSVHTYGAAVDLTLWDNARQHECDLGTPFDHLGPRAEPRREEALLRAGKLTAAQVRRRRLLRAAMVEGGFLPISREWWHFDAWRGTPLRRRYTALDVPVTYGLPQAGAPAAAPPPQ